MPKRGILGGTFDPIHFGHLLAAEQARIALELAEVIVVPAGDPWMRTPEQVSSKEDRWNMVLLGTESNPYLVPSRVDLDRPGASYAVDTLRDLVHGKPGAGDYWFILGADSLAGLPHWREPERLFSLCRIAVVTRPSYDIAPALAVLGTQIPASNGRVDSVPGLEIGISATDIRLRRRAGLSIKYRVPDSVERYIMERGLYQGETLAPRGGKGPQP